MNNAKITSIVITGVGGQGTLLASRIIGGAAILQGLDVKVSEVHGMAQRGGSVITHVRFGAEVHSPIVGQGGADYVLAFELLEAYRAIPYVKPKTGRVITGKQTINPMPVVMGEASYPSDIEKKLSGFGITVEGLDAAALAREAGSVKAANVVLIGKLASVMDYAKDVWLAVINQTVKPAFLELNSRAFMLGWDA
jgi:indolepyruvate ferredoxin oxidoreductase beta subunit